jgi:hypothetical protein
MGAIFCPKSVLWFCCKVTSVVEPEPEAEP